MVTRSPRKASCSTPELPPQEKRGRQRWRGGWGVRWSRQRKTSRDADDCPDWQRDGGHWQGRVVPDRWGSGTPALPVWTRPFDQPWASEDRVVTASHARTSPLDWPAVQQRSVRTAADRWGTLEDRLGSVAVVEARQHKRDDQWHQHLPWDTPSYTPYLA